MNKLLCSCISINKTNILSSLSTPSSPRKTETKRIRSLSIPKEPVISNNTPQAPRCKDDDDTCRSYDSTFYDDEYFDKLYKECDDDTSSERKDSIDVTITTENEVRDRSKSDIYISYSSIEDYPESIILSCNSCDEELGQEQL